mgnify:CR=1 FL=1
MFARLVEKSSIFSRIFVSSRNSSSLITATLLSGARTATSGVQPRNRDRSVRTFGRHRLNLCSMVACRSSQGLHRSHLLPACPGGKSPRTGLLGLPRHRRPQGPIQRPLASAPVGQSTDPPRTRPEGAGSRPAALSPKDLLRKVPA